MAAWREFDTHAFQAQARGVRYRPDGDQCVACVDDAAVSHRHSHPGFGPDHRISAGILDQRHTALGEHLLEHHGGIAIFMRQDLIAAGHHRHRDAEFGVGVAEFRAGDTGAHDHQMFGQLGEVVELSPVKDSLTVRFGAGQHPGTRASGDQHHVGLEHPGPTIGGGDLNPVICHPRHAVDQLGAAGHHVDIRRQQLGADIGRLRTCQGLDPVVDLGERDLGVVDSDVEAHAGGSAQLGAHAGRGDEGLGRYAVE